MYPGRDDPPSHSVLMVAQSLKGRRSLAHDSMGVKFAFVGVSVVYYGKHPRITYGEQIWRQAYNGALTDTSERTTMFCWDAKSIPYFLWSASCDVGMCFIHRA